MILVTGAAGGLGSRVVARLLRDGHRVRATDRHQPAKTPDCEWRQCDLTDSIDVAALLPGVTRVAHLGNHPRADNPQKTFGENVTNNLNVFQSALEAGARRLVFASSMQAIVSASPGGGVAGTAPALPQRLPLDGATPANPGNTYGLSKQVGEETLAYYCRNHGLSGCALRFPSLYRDIAELRDAPYQPLPIDIAQGFTWLSYDDAARLVVAALFTDHPGCRTYLPASPEPRCGLSVAETTARFYPAVPWHPDAPRAGLTDPAALLRDFSWSPRDSALPRLHPFAN